MKSIVLLSVNILMSLVMRAADFTPPELFKPANESTMQPPVLELQWFYPTPAQEGTIVYDLYFGENPNPPLFRENLTSINGPINPEGSEFTFDATMAVEGVTRQGMVYIHLDPIANEATYYWKVVAKSENGEVQSSELFSFTTVRENTLPSPSSLISPANRAVNVASQTTLKWTEAIDADGDEVTYTVYFRAGSSGNMEKLSTGLTTNSYTIPFRLEDQQTYYWFVVAVDGYDKRAVRHESGDEIWDFTVENYSNDSPEKVQLALPLNGAFNTTWKVTLLWESSVDRDGDQVLYDIYMDQHANPKTLLAADITTPGKHLQLEKKYTTYYWKVVAKDGKGGKSESDVYSFRPWKRAPAEFIEMVKVEGGSFMMGQPDPTIGHDEQPVHPVNLDSYLIGKYEVTWAQFCDFLNAIKESVTVFQSTFLPITTYVKFNSQEGSIICAISESKHTDFGAPKIYWDGSSFVVKEGFETYPVENMTSYGARLFCQWAKVRLPTEAEWEYAAKGGNQSKGYIYSGSNELGEVAWYFENAENPYNPMTSYHIPVSGAGNGTHKAGTKPPNELGIYDMSGNVQELVHDWYEENYYEISPADNPQGPESIPENNPSFLYRGGYWMDRGSQARNCARRAVQYVGEYSSKNFWGFRVAENASENTAPGKVSLVFPADNTNGVDEAIALSWQSMEDPQGDMVVYDVYAGTAASPETRIAENTTLTSVSFKDIASNTTYYWKVIAKDNKGNIAQESSVWKFSTTDINKYTFSGTVLSEFGTPVKDVELLGLGSKVSTDIHGEFSVQINEGWTGTVRPFKLDYSFTPESIEIYNLSEDFTDFAISAKFTYRHTIAIRINDVNGQPVSGAQVEVGSTLINPWNNWYIAYQNAGWSGTIQPFLEGYTFSPNNIEVNLLEKDMEVYFTASYVGVHTISGAVVDDTGNGVPGVTLSGFSNPVTTDANGHYTTTENKGWSGTIIPQLQDHVFMPDRLTIPQLADNSLDNNFVASRNDGLYHTISGTIRDKNGDPLSKVILTGFSNTVLTGTHGEYISTEPNGWNATVIPQLEGYTFTPENINFSNLTATSSGNDFTGIAEAAATYLIGGTIYDDKGNPLSNVTLNGFSNVTTTNAYGEYYSFENKGWSGTIIPQLDKFVFTPENLTIQNLDMVIEQDFTAASVVTSVVDPQTMFSYKIYPNPSSARFTVEVSEKAHIQIITIDGKQILNTTIFSKNLISLKEKGAYVVKLRLNGKDYSRTIIIE